MDMAAAFMAFQRQAAEHIAACNQQLAAAGLGFTPEDREVIAAQAAAHPFPAGHDPDAAASAEDVATAQAMTAKAMAAEYPRDGFAPDDPRLAPIEGVSLAVYAVAAKAIGWSTEPAFIDRVVRAVGIDPA